MTVRMPPIAALLVGYAFFAFTALVPEWWSANELPMPAALKPFAAELLMLVLTLTLMAIDRRPWRAFGFCTPDATWKDWLLAIPLGAMCGVLATVLIFVTPAQGMFSLMKDKPIWQVLLMLWIMAPLVEELFVRGLVQTWMDGTAKRTISLGFVRMPVPALTGALLFGAMHLMLLHHGIDGLTTTIIVCMTASLGLVTGYYRAKTKSLAIPLAAHVAFNLASQFVGAIFMIAQKLAERGG